MRLDELIRSRSEQSDTDGTYPTPDFLKGAKGEISGRGRKITGIRFITPDEPVKPEQDQCD